MAVRRQPRVADSPYPERHCCLTLFTGIAAGCLPFFLLSSPKLSCSSKPDMNRVVLSIQGSVVTSLFLLSWCLLW